MPRVPPVHSRFQPGQSGNPKGRPRKLPDLDRLIAQVMGDEKGGVTAAEAVLRSLLARATRGDVRAAEVLLDRAYGKQRQPVEGGVTLTVVRRDEAAAALPVARAVIASALPAPAEAVPAQRAGISISGDVVDAELVGDE